MRSRGEDPLPYFALLEKKIWYEDLLWNKKRIKQNFMSTWYFITSKTVIETMANRIRTLLNSNSVSHFTYIQVFSLFVSLLGIIYTRYLIQIGGYVGIYVSCFSHKVGNVGQSIQTCHHLVWGRVLSKGLDWVTLFGDEICPPVSSFYTQLLQDLINKGWIWR